MDAKQDKYHVEKKRASPVKVLSSQLRDGECCNGHQGKMEYNLKGLGEANNTRLVVSVVWMQGTVLEVTSDNSARLSDETGTFVVNGFRNIPKGKPCLSQGEYIMVMGVIQALFPEPVLRAVKTANLGVLSEMHRRMWKFEVEDVQNVLTQ